MTVAAADRPASLDRRVQIGLVFLFLVAAGVFPVLSQKMQDYEVYWRAASRALEGAPLYRLDDGHWLFKYLPGFAVAMAPMALLPMQAAKAIWFMATIAALVAVFRITLLLLPEVRKPAWMLITVTVLVMGSFYGHEIKLGQSNLLLLATVAGALLAIKRGREVLAGVLLAAAVLFKPYAVIFLPWLVVRRRLASIVAAAVGVAAILALPAIRYGVESTIQLHLAWWRTATLSTESTLLSPENVSWLAMFSRWFGEGTLAQALTAATTLAAMTVVAFMLWRRRGVRFPDLLECSVLLFLIPLISPQGWQYTLLFATPAVMCLLNYDDRLPNALRIAVYAALVVLGLGIYDVMGRDLYRAFMEQSVVTLAFFVVIAAVVELRRRQVV